MAVRVFVFQTVFHFFLLMILPFFNNLPTNSPMSISPSPSTSPSSNIASIWDEGSWNWRVSFILRWKLSRFQWWRSRVKARCPTNNCYSWGNILISISSFIFLSPLNVPIAMMLEAMILCLSIVDWIFSVFDIKQRCNKPIAEMSSLFTNHCQYLQCQYVM